MLLISIIAIITCIVANALLPMIAFFSTGKGPQCIAGSFTPEGVQNALNYMKSDVYWDKWLIIIVGSILLVLTFLYAVKYLFKGKFLSMIVSLLSVAIYGVCIYIYFAWPRQDLFETWHRVLFYVSLCLPAASTLLTAVFIDSKEK